MSKATESQLAALHGKVAEVMTSALDQSSKAESLLIKYVAGVPASGEEDAELVALPDDIIDFLETCVAVNPSLLTAAAKFLKDNNITSDPGEDNDLKKLQEKLDKNKKKSVADLPIFN